MGKSMCVTKLLHCCSLLNACNGINLFTIHTTCCFLQQNVLPMLVRCAFMHMYSMLLITSCPILRRVVARAPSSQEASAIYDASHSLRHGLQHTHKSTLVQAQADAGRRIVQGELCRKDIFFHLSDLLRGRITKYVGTMSESCVLMFSSEPIAIVEDFSTVYGRSHN